MFAGNRVCVSTIFLFFILFYPHAAHSETFKSAEFLTWKQRSQDLYIHTSVSMAGQIAAQNDMKHVKCLEDWYFDDEVAANDFVRQTMRKFPEFHPRGVILAVMEKKCGSFNYSER